MWGGAGRFVERFTVYDILWNMSEINENHVLANVYHDSILKTPTCKYAKDHPRATGGMVIRV